jgi:cephalosporin hydroxylase
MFSTLKRIFRNFEKIVLFFSNRLRIRYNNVGKFFPSELKELNEVRHHSIQSQSDIDDHLETLFIESLKVRPKLILELGVRKGESTYVFERIAKIFNSTLISVDIADCSDISTYDKWFFVKKDDIEFANNFLDWCQNRKIEPKIDILFIDTSHLYEHTKEEIAHWFPYLSDECKVFFHDTNLKEVVAKKNGSLCYEWNNERGVIRAIEEFFGKRFNENIEFTDFINGWLITHNPLSNGLTILELIRKLEN